jgi:hypothetical protein
LSGGGGVPAPPSPRASASASADVACKTSSPIASQDRGQALQEGCNRRGSVRERERYGVVERERLGTRQVRHGAGVGLAIELAEASGRVLGRLDRRP